MTLTYLEPGQAYIITRGTLRLQDLLTAYATELEAVDATNQFEELVEEAHAYAGVIDREEFVDEELYTAYEQAHYILEGLEDALNEHAPDTHYFGTDENTPDEKGWLPLPNDEQEQY